MVKRALWFTGFLALGAAVIYIGWLRLLQVPLTVESLYTVPAGSSASQLCLSWQQQQKVSAADCLLLRLYLKVVPEAARVQQGVYRITDERTLLQILALFKSGKEAQFSLTFIEGETVQQALLRLANAEYLQQDVSAAEQITAMLEWPTQWGDKPSNSEALLYPDTYYYTANSSASQIIRRSQQALLQQLANAWQQRLTDLPVETPYQLLTLASIIEKESRYAPERPLVASVFVNRLRKNMRLQTDPTVIYGLTNFNGNITRADLNNPHPYNTYRHHGLPPGPIAMVSQQALLAAAQPAETDLYYFVSKGDGTHQFSSTLEQHNAAVRKYIFGEQ